MRTRKPVQECADTLDVQCDDMQSGRRRKAVDFPMSIPPASFATGNAQKAHGGGRERSTGYSPMGPKARLSCGSVPEKPVSEPSAAASASFGENLFS